MDPVTVILLGIVILFLFYKWATYYHDYFEKINLPSLRPRFLIGNLFELNLSLTNPVTFWTNVYNKFPDEK